MHERHLTVGSNGVALIEAGVGGRPLLLVHGFTGAKEDFSWPAGGFDYVNRLANLGWHVVAIDLYGHGGSTHFDASPQYSFGTYVQQLLGVIDSLGWDQCVLLGHSMGGMIAEEFAVTHGDRLAALILMNTHHGAINHVDPVMIPLAKQVAAESGIVGIKAVLDSLNDRPTGSNYSHRVAMDTIAGYEALSNAKMLASSGVMFATMLEAMVNRVDRLEFLATLSLPTMVMIGDYDDGFLAASARMASVIPDVKYRMILGGGHSPQFEAPDGWWAAMTEFLESLDADSADLGTVGAN